MRPALIATLVSVAAGIGPPARAELIADPPEPTAPHADFWRAVDDPHADEVAALLLKCAGALRAADRSRGQDLDAASLDNRDRLYREVTDILVYARRLSPSNVEVLELLGAAADEAGRPRLALDALHAAIAAPREPIPRVDPDVPRDDRASATRIAGIYLRLGQLDDAIYWARTAVTNQLLDRNDQASVYLATALALRGDMPAAIDTLQLREQGTTLAAFALVVQLDRDEQRGAAADALGRLHSRLTESFAETVLDDLAKFRFAPPEDEHYYVAMLDESLEAYPEARAEWLTYAAFDTPYRRRALEHVVAIDAMRRARPTAAPILPRLPPPPTFRRRIHP